MTGVFGLTGGEIAVLGVVALVVIGPRNLPAVLRSVGRLVGTARARGIDLVGVALIALAMLLVAVTLLVAAR